MKKNLVLLSFILSTAISFAQKDKIYKSFEDAFRNPAQVYRLKITFKNRLN